MSHRKKLIEAKSRVASTDTITVAKNEILASLNQPGDYVLAIVEVLGDDQHRLRNVRRPFRREPGFGVTSVNYDLAELLERAGEPT